jgi:DNA-binding CsgD family transcriptional regulator
MCAVDCTERDEEDMLGGLPVVVLDDDPGDALAPGVPWAPARLALWHGLLAGRWTLVEHEERDGVARFVARRNLPEEAARLALTPRERQVVARSALGLSLKIIASELGLGVSTVATDRARAMRKLGVRSLADLAALLRGAEERRP